MPRERRFSQQLSLQDRYRMKMEKIRFKEKEMQRKRSKDLRKIARESKQIMRKFCNSKNVINDMAAEIDRQQYGSDSDKDASAV